MGTKRKMVQQKEGKEDFERCRTRMGRIIRHSSAREWAEATTEKRKRLHTKKRNVRRGIKWFISFDRLT